MTGVESFAAELLRHLRNERQGLINTMAKGGMLDFAQYRSTVGQLQCLDSLEARIKQLFEMQSGEYDNE